ncbi:MAG: glutamine synthetase [Calditrichaeota bacterium]|nr:MAG: glutamine synthetase [Calditrichota bacterium]MBL1203921.1 glutamine synthetase [Calditrichota bacterium]NOG43754.1 glutamine synthetase [Calditrichota bacterium]
MKTLALNHILDKPKTEITREDILTVIKDAEINKITFHYVGIDSKLKELKIPINDLKHAERVLAEGERVDGSSLFKGLIDASVSDLYVVPLYKTAFINPFDYHSINFMCRFLDRDGNPASYGLDSVLHRANHLLKKNSGLELYALGELEFFLISEPDNNSFPIARQHGYHATAPFTKSGEILDEMLTYLSQITGIIKYAHNEVGCINYIRSDVSEIKGKQAEQMEIEFLAAPIEDAADYLLLARWLIRNVAYKHNCVATFAPKLEEGIAGNGFHVHMELRKNGQNIMLDKDNSLSEEAKKLIGGLSHYAASLTAFGNTTSSAYLRLVPNQEAPTHICWSDLNRSAMIRVPLAWGKEKDLARNMNPQQTTDYSSNDSRQTVELRSPDGSAIIHFLLAGITMAAEWGLTNEKSLEKSEKLYVSGNIFKNHDVLKSLPILPASCVGSAQILLESRDLYEREDVFPSSIIDYMAKLLQKEDDEQMNDKLADLPADDRLEKTRAIMHKDIHRH